MKAKLIIIFSAAIVVLSIMVPFLVFGETPLFEEPELPKEPLIPGRIEGIGTYFEIKDSGYLNIILESSEEVKIVLESIPRMISLDIEASGRDVNTTELIIGSLAPNKTYYKYQDSYKNEAVFISSENGAYSWVQDLSWPHHIWFQEIKGTTFIDKDTVLDSDITGSVEIIANNIILDCNGHSITGSGGGYGIYLKDKSGVTIKNCSVNNFWHDIYLYNSSNNILSNNTVTNKYNNYASGIFLYNSPSNSLIDNAATSNEAFGIYLYESGNNTLINNTMANNRDNFALGGTSDDPFINTIDTTNTVDGNPIYYILNATDQVYDGTTNAGVFYCIFCNNITVKDLMLTKNSRVFFWKTENSRIEKVAAPSNTYDISLHYSNNNIVLNSQTYGIHLVHSNKNTLSNNVGPLSFSFSNNNVLINNVANYGTWAGIYLSSSNSNILDSNTANSNKYYGIYLESSHENVLINNNTSKNLWGIAFYSSNNNTLEGNIVSFNDPWGIMLSHSLNTTLISNTIFDNLWNFAVYGGLLSEFIHNIDTSNKINDKPIQYLIGQENVIIDSSWDIGYLGVVNSTNITIKDLTLSNNGQGILFTFSNNSEIKSINVSDTRDGILLINEASNNNLINNDTSNNIWGIPIVNSSDNNTLINNNISNNNSGIDLTSSSNNKIYHNNFINNVSQACIYKEANNFFDSGYPDGGNYWSDYTGVDLYKGFEQDQVGSDGIGDTPYTFTGGEDKYPFVEESGWEAPPPALPDFSISEIKPVQVVWDSDINGDGKIDLVAGKSTMIWVEGMGNYETLDKQQLVEVRLNFDGVDYTESRTIEQLEQNNRIEFYPALPSAIGDQVITAKVDPENKIEELNENNNENFTEITVKDTNDLYLVYFPVDKACVTTIGFPLICGGYGPIDMEEYATTVSQSSKFISATYPVAEIEFTNEKSDWKYYGNPVPYLGLINDAISIWTRGELVTRTQANVSIGIVPEDYFGYHLLEETKGISLSLPGINGVLAEEGYWTTTAHEIGHRFGLRLDEEEYVTNPPGNRADGFWVSERREISNGVCFMGKAGANHSFSHSIKYDNRPIWVDNEDYKHLFKEFRLDKTDPDVLLVSGIISKDGTIQLGKLYMVENGMIDYIIPGDYAIQILDTNGQVVTSVPFYTSFKMYINPFGIVDTDFAGFTLTIPYPEAASKIQIQYNGKTLIEINPNSKLLYDAVDSIPNHGFINNPEQRRNALHNKINAVEKMIEEGNYKGAINKLEFDIKDKLEKWLVDGYQKENLEQLLKVEVIELIQAIIDRLSNQ